MSCHSDSMPALRASDFSEGASPRPHGRGYSMPRRPALKQDERNSNWMNISRYIAIVLIVFAPRLLQAQVAPTPWLTAAERTKFETLRTAGSEALFNLDYEAARKNFKEMAVSFPNYPAGPQFL